MNCGFVYVTDEQGLELASHSAVSVALSQHKPCDIHIFCHQFSPRPSPTLASGLRDLRASLSFHTIGNPVVEQHKIWGHVTTPSLLKLEAVSRLIERYDRIVYLDNDILVFDDLEMETIDFGHHPIAAVTDMDLSPTGWLRDSVWAGLDKEGGRCDGYFNSGVLIFASENWNGAQFQERYAAALDQHDVACSYKLDCTSTDQCALNFAFEDSWVRLPLSYNMQASAKFTASWRTAAVRHYCGRRKAIPVSAFRSDSRDVRYLNRIRQAIGKGTTKLPNLYDVPFYLNAVRNYGRSRTMRRFIRDFHTQDEVGPRSRSSDTAKAKILQPS